MQATTPWLETAERLSAGDQGGGARRRVDEVKGGRRARILLEPLTSDLPCTRQHAERSRRLAVGLRSYQLENDFIFVFTLAL